MQLNQLKRNTPNRKKALIGRGGKRGKTSGRGMKGQTARAGNKTRPQMRDIIKKLPKLRGYRFSSIQTKPMVVNVSSLNIFEDGTTINPKFLLENKLVRQTKGDTPKVKILGNGELSKKLNFEKCIVSNTAKEKIEKMGGIVK